MKIFLLTLTKKGDEYFDYDCYEGHIVVAKNENGARELCQCGTECHNFHGGSYSGHHDRKNCIWMNRVMVSCKEIGTSTNKTPKVILSSFNAG